MPKFRLNQGAARVSVAVLVSLVMPAPGLRR